MQGEARKGIAAIIAACAVWGFAPLLYHHIAEVPALEIMAHRTLWTAVLLGAIAAARAARTYDTVILRVMGASRGQLLLMQLGEYGLLGVLLALVALALGSAIAWGVIVQLFAFAWLPDWTQVLGVLGIGLALVIGFAIAASLPVLRARPAAALREL